ncbi:N-formylglutamate amidohydrolase [Faecalispora jeddahensis]|uniref:N-formylglutamate amidohydrolase n=1 Tax=Faecalispora jeddahensis TaxID=1414721 RepID=UPI0027BA6064|nr:N-formylglutamate amidohydrolase [Faecalispora jeddahensis]
MEYFTILNENTHQFPLVIDLPHSGTLVPPHIRSRMLDTACLSNTDWFLPELYDFLPAMGCTTIVNHLSRYVVDVNRPTGGAKDGDYRNTVVYQQNTQGSPLYAIPLEEKEINERITQYYQPYHQALENLLRAKLQVFPSVLLLDLHSFFINFANGGNQDIYLSNRCGATSSEQTLQALHNGFETQGYTVLDNAILGGHSIHHYRKLFQERFEGILVELRYTKYIEDRYFVEEEITTRNEALFKEAKRRLQTIFTQLPFLNG